MCTFRSLAIAATGCLCMSAAVSLHASEAEPTLILTTEELAPFNYVDRTENRLKGIAIDLNEEIMKQAGIRYEIKMLPWARAYSRALDEANVCAFATYVTDKRKPLFKWVGPLLVAKWSLYARKGSGIRINSLEDARKYRIGGYIADAPTGYLKDLNFNVAEVNRNELNAHKLAAGRIDLWATGDPSGAWIAKMEGVDSIENIFTFLQIPMSYSCNKAVPDAMLFRMQRALDELERSGVAARIRQGY
jgi:polar amino acid transport system substrate-binding protein